MYSQQLLDYISAQRKAGAERGVIVETLRTAGWSENDINAALVAEGVPAPPAPVPTLPPEQAPAATAVGAGSPTPEANTHRSWARLLTIGVSVLVLVVLVAGVAYAYVEKIGPFSSPPYTENNLFSGLLTKAALIRTSTYEASSTLIMEPREADAKPFTYQPPSKQLIAEYTNDAQRAQSVSNILMQLQYATRYPASLLQLQRQNNSHLYNPVFSISINDPVTNKPYDYTLTNGGKNFALSVTFQTSDAIQAIQREYGYSATNTPITGQTVTFTKNSPTYYYLSSTPPKPFFVQMQDMASYFPPQLAVAFSLGATVDWAHSADWKFNLSASGDFGDLTYKVGGDALKKDGVYYLRINDIPGIVGMLADYKGKWIKYDPATATTTATAYPISELSSITSQLPQAEKDYKKQRAAYTKLLLMAANIADSVHLMHFKTPPVVDHVNGRTLYRYELVLNKDAIVPFYTKLLAAAKQDPDLANAPFVTDTGLINYLKSPEFDSVFAYYNENTALTLWVDPQGFPAQLSYSIRFVPPDTATALKDKQARLTFTLNMSRINQPVTIQAPSGAKTVEQLVGTSTPGGIGL
ncbi:MAG: hypothetical protein B7X04_02290 [Parcubacteria group bacterium 21-54-25]|nr:MAG: hypothetical protein B7X04_02290 [Parcubacteria group bacterium 21-54-25]HQU07877.1 hypothetical protein [Candidatus Paceibacterota bacterium]